MARRADLARAGLPWTAVVAVALAGCRSPSPSPPDAVAGASSGAGNSPYPRRPEAPSVAAPPPTGGPSTEIDGGWGECRLVGGKVALDAWRGASPSPRVPIGGEASGHYVKASLEERPTSEGIQRQAFVSLDDGPPVRLSEEGSGATYVELVPRGRDVMAAMLDARRGMTPVHARVLSLKDGRVNLGNDAVVFIGGAPESHTRLTVAAARSGQTFVLLPMAKDALAFGMAVIHVDDPPKDDSPVAWSLYPNGLDPAPAAATHTEGVPYAARVRPEDARPEALQVLELVRLGPSAGGDAGATPLAVPSVTILGQLARARRIRAVSVLGDGTGGISISYESFDSGARRDPTGRDAGGDGGATDASGAWTVQVRCPP